MPFDTVGLANQPYLHMPSDTVGLTVLSQVATTRRQEFHMNWLTVGAGMGTSEKGSTLSELSIFFN